MWTSRAVGFWSHFFWFNFCTFVIIIWTLAIYQILRSYWQLSQQQSLQWDLTNMNVAWFNKNQKFSLREKLMNGVLVTPIPEILRYASELLVKSKSTLVKVMACCQRATSHCLHQCWPRYLMLYGVIRVQWVNVLRAKFVTCYGIIFGPPMYLFCFSKVFLGFHF